MKKRHLLLFFCGFWLFGCSPAYAETFPKQGLSFDGIDDLVDVPSLTSSMTTEGGVELVLKNPAPGNSYYLLGGNTHTRTYLVIRGSGTVQMTKGEPKVELTSTKVVTDGKKHTISLFWKDAYAWFYIDGELQGETSFAYTVLNGTIMKLGRHTVTEGQYAKMDLLEFRLWNKVLSETMIQQNVNQSLTGNESGLASLYQFNPYTTKLVYDQTPTHNHATAAGFTKTFLQPRLTSQHLDHLAFACTRIPDATYRIKRNGVVVYTGSANTWRDDSVVRETSYTYSFQALTPEGESREETIDATADLPYSMPFDGVDDIVRADDAPQFQPSNVTMEVWIRPERWGTMTRAFMAKRTSTHNGYMFFYDAAAGTVHVDWGGFTQRWNTGYTPPLNRWTHLAYTYDGSNGRLYVNGNLQATTTLGNSGLVPTTSSFSIGRDPLYNTYVFNGRLSEVRLWNKARTQTEIQGDLYRSLQGTEPHLMAYYPLNGMYNKKVWDFSAYQQVAYTSRFPISHTNVGVGIQSGDLTITGKPSDASTTVTLTGNRDVTTLSLTPLTIADGRGNGAGWSLSVAATPFQEVGGAGYTFEPGSLLLLSPRNVTALSAGMRTILPALTDVPSLSIDEGNSLTLAVANINEGMGTFQFTFPNEALHVVMNPAYARVDPVAYSLTPTLYTSTMTWVVASGP